VSELRPGTRARARGSAAACCAAANFPATSSSATRLASGGYVSAILSQSTPSRCRNESQSARTPLSGTLLNDPTVECGGGEFQLVFLVKKRGPPRTPTLIDWLLAEFVEEFRTVTDEVIGTDPLDGNVIYKRVLRLHHPRKPFLMLDYRCKVVEDVRIAEPLIRPQAFRFAFLDIQMPAA